MDRLDFGWLRIFRETAQLRSISAAAARLGLSQPAVSYQIRRLEEQLGFAVFERSSRGVEPTPAGRRLLEAAARHLDELDGLIHELRTERQRPTVRLRTDYAFSAFWLMPRMDAFRRLHPDIDIQIVATQRFDQAQMETGDVAVIFADPAISWRGARLLVAEEVVPVCGRDFFAKLDASGLPASLAHARLIHLDATGATPWFDWPGYFAATGLARLRQDGASDISFNTYSLVLQAALENQGVAIGWTGLIDAHVRLGFLTPVGPSIRRDERGYFLLPPQSPNAATEAFTTWLVEA